MENLYINLFLYLGYTLYWWKKVPHLTIHNMLSLWITIIAGVGIFSVQFGYYQFVYGNTVHFPLEAYLFGFVAFLIIMWPFRLLNTKDIVFVGFSNNIEKILVPLIKICLVLFFVRLIICSKAAIYALQFDPKEIYQSQHYEGTTLYKFSPLEVTLNFYIDFIYNILNPIFLYYACISLTKPKCAHKMLFFCVFAITCLLAFSNCIMTGARGGIFVFTSLMALVVLPFWKKFPSSIRYKFKNAGLIMLTFFAIYTISMTLSRFEDAGTKESPLEGIFRYFGEPFPNLGNMLWDKVKIHPFGVRLYPYFFSETNIASNAASITDEFYAWEKITGVPLYIFKTEFGDFYIEFGKYVSLIVMFLYSLLFRCFIKKGVLEISSIPIFYYFLDIAVSSPMDFAKRYLFHIYILIACVILYFVIHYLFKLNDYGKK